MQLIAPDILTEVRALSLPLCGVGFSVGLLLWATGWRAHRFWIVLAATSAAGLGGLLHGPSTRVQPVVAAVLLALAAGMLALALVRVVAFVGGGLAAWLAVRSLGPSGWDDPVLCFVAGGLLGLVSFRLCAMALTSLAGAVLMAYCGLSLAHQFGRLDAVAIADRGAGLINWGCIGCAVVGLCVQLLWDRRHRLNVKRREEEDYGAGWGRDWRGWWRTQGRPRRRAG